MIEQPTFLGVNPVEYHGPHLSLENDAHLSFGAAGELWSLMGWEGELNWAGELGVGSDPVPGPGSVPVPPRKVKRAVLDASRRLARQGVTRLVLITLHGAPLHNAAIYSAAKLLEREGLRVYTPAATLFEHFLEPDMAAMEAAYAPVPEPLRSELKGRVKQDFHGGFLETSLALHWAPETVKNHRDVLPCPRTDPDRRIMAMSKAAARLGRRRLALELEFAAEAAGWALQKPFPGYTSVPSAATAETGRLIADHVLPACARAAHKVLNQGHPCPKPMMNWLNPLTLGGSVPLQPRV